MTYILFSFSEMVKKYEKHDGKTNNFFFIVYYKKFMYIRYILLLCGWHAFRYGVLTRDRIIERMENILFEW